MLSTGVVSFEIDRFSPSRLELDILEEVSFSWRNTNTDHNSQPCCANAPHWCTTSRRYTALGMFHMKIAHDNADEILLLPQFGIALNI